MSERIYYLVTAGESLEKYKKVVEDFKEITKKWFEFAKSIDGFNEQIMWNDEYIKELDESRTVLKAISLKEKVKNWKKAYNDGFYQPKKNTKEYDLWNKLPKAVSINETIRFFDVRVQVFTSSKILYTGLELHKEGALISVGIDHEGKFDKPNGEFKELTYSEVLKLKEKGEEL